MFPIAATILLAGGPIPEVIATTRNLELSLKVIEAFENGPVILDVSITNRGEKELLTTCAPGYSQIDLRVPKVDPFWRSARLPWAGCPGRFIFESRLKPGESWAVRYYLQLSAGTHDLTVSWPLHYLPPQKGAESDDWRTVALPTKVFSVTVTPSTPANRYSLATRFEAEFAALPKVADCDQRRNPTPSSDLIEKVRDTPHRELYSLSLRLLDREAALASQYSDRSHIRARLITTLFRLDHATTHKHLVDRLLTDPPGIEAKEVFECWLSPPKELADIGQDETSAALDPFFWLRYKTRPHLFLTNPAAELLAWLQFSAPCMLPRPELKRLAGVQDFWVRAWVYVSFGEQLDAKWSEAFLKDARQQAATSPKPRNVSDLPFDTDVWRVSALFRARGKADQKLLEAFAAGAEDNPYAIAARKELELKKKESP